MPRGMQVLPIERPGGLRDLPDSTELAPEEWTWAGNVDIAATPGKTKVRLGCDKLHTSSEFANDVNTLFAHDGFYFAADGAEIDRFTLAGVVTSIATGFSASYRWTAAALPGQKIVFWSNGYNESKKTYAANYSTIAKWGIFAPAHTISETPTGSGSFSATTGYKYLYSYWNDATATRGELYPLSSGAPNATSTGTFSNKASVDLANIPATFPDTQATHMEIWRTQDGGSVYYRVTRVAEGTTSYSDSTSDAVLVLGEVLITRSGIPQYGVPVACKYIAAWQNRIWQAGDVAISAGTVTTGSGDKTVTCSAANWTPSIYKKRFHNVTGNWWGTVDTYTDTSNFELAENPSGAVGAGQSYEILGYPGMVYYSASGDGERMTSFQSIEVPTDGKPITAIFAWKRQLLVFTEYSMHKITGYDETGFSVTTISRSIGCVSQASCCEIEEPDGVVFRASNGWYLYDATTGEPRLISAAIQSFLDSQTTPTAATACWFPKKRWLVCGEKVGGWNTTIFISNRRREHWSETQQEYKWVRWYPVRSESLMAIRVDGTEHLLAGDHFGFVWEYEIADQYYDNVNLTGTATGSGTTTLTDSAASFPTTGDGLKGEAVVHVPNAGTVDESFRDKERYIDSNTGTQITINGTGWENTVAVGDTYIIGRYFSTVEYGDIAPAGRDSWAYVRSIRAGTTGGDDSSQYMAKIEWDRGTTRTKTRVVTSTSGSQQDIPIGDRGVHMKLKLWIRAGIAFSWDWLHILFRPGGAKVD